MTNHQWPFSFPPECSISDLKPKDLYELIIKAVAEGNKESNRDSRIGAVPGRQSADAVRAALESRRVDLIQG